MLNLFSRGSQTIAALIALCVVASSAFAQVEYVRELIGTSDIGEGQSVLSISQGPVYTTDPFYTNTPTQTILSINKTFTVDSASGVVTSAFFPDGVSLANYSKISIVGQGSTERLIYELGASGEIYTINPQRNDVVYLPVPFIEAIAIDFYSVAAKGRDSAEVSFIYANAVGGLTAHAMLNRETGATTDTSVMSHLGTQAFYQSYGADGFLYILDYGNERMVSFDPTDDFAQIGTFDLNTSVTTANVQFAIGVNGNFYLGDGLGGGSIYAADGTYLGSFTLPVGVVGDPYTGASYVSTDSAGRVYVYDSATGFHQYQDVGVVPEPSTATFLILSSVFGALAFRRRL